MGEQDKSIFLVFEQRPCMACAGAGIILSKDLTHKGNCIACNGTKVQARWRDLKDVLKELGIDVPERM